MKAVVKATVDVKVILELNATEVQALDALAGYGYKNFMAVFYTYLGKHYMEPHADGIRTLFEKIEPLKQVCHQIEKVARQLPPTIVIK